MKKKKNFVRKIHLNSNQMFYGMIQDIVQRNPMLFRDKNET